MDANTPAQPAAQWWRVYVPRGSIGAVHCTREEILAAVGPWCRIQGNAVEVFAPPPKHKRERKRTRTVDSTSGL